MNSRLHSSRAALALALLVSMLASSLSAFAQTATTALPKGIEHVTSVEGINEYRLANGLRVLMFPDQSKQTITVNMTYLVGSATENYGETGMAPLARAYGLQRESEAYEHSAGVDFTRLASQWLDVVSTAPTILRPSPPPTKTSTGHSIWNLIAWSIPSSPGKTSTAR